MSAARPSALLLAPAALLLGALSGCTQSTETGVDAIAVTASDSSCEVAQTDLTAGNVTFAIANEGAKVTEVYVYDGTRIVSEKENIGPGTSYKLTMSLPAGDYEIACKPGQVGDGIRQTISVSGAGGAEDSAKGTAAVEEYRAWVLGQAEALIPAVDDFVAAVTAGDVGQAKALYAPSRIPWESVEPVAESFGDLDPRVDLREADLEPGQQWTGWHRLEKVLWTTGDLTGMVPVAEQLAADARLLAAQVSSAPMTAASIGNGAKELLDEIATGKITGEEEAFSHTDLVDFQANLDGASQAFDVLRPLIDDNALVDRLDAEFATVQTELDAYRAGDGFVSYDTVTPEQRRKLARAVDALSEPLSYLTAAVVE